jgi:hypothetical protein
MTLILREIEAHVDATKTTIVTTVMTYELPLLDVSSIALHSLKTASTYLCLSTVF